MNSILKFNDRFEAELGRVLEVPWFHLRLKLLHKLHKTVTSSLSSAQQLSYISELREYILFTLDKIVHDPNSFSGDPELLENSISIITGDNLTKDDELMTKVIHLISKKYFRLNAYAQLLKFWENKGIDLGDIDEKNLTGLPMNEFLKTIKDELPSHLLDNLNCDIKNEPFRSSPNTINGLFVVRDDSDHCGVLSQLSLEKITVSDHLHEDQVRVVTHLVDESDILSEQTRAVCFYLRSQKNYSDKYHIRLEFSLNQPSSLLVGSSVGLAMAVLATTSLHMYKSNRALQLRIYSDVAFTGAIDKSGKILPVDEYSIESKIEAAFFSDVRMVVLAEDQVQQAINSVEKLQKDYSNHALEIIGLKKVTDIQQRRDIIHYQRRRISSRVSQFVKDYANSVTYSIMAFILLLGAGFWFGIVKHPVPEKSTFLNDQIVVLNRYGYELWKSEIGSYTSAVDDIDNDGEMEVLVGFSSDIQNSKYQDGRVICYNESGEILWEMITGLETIYGNNVYPNNFIIPKIIIDDLDGDGKKEIICVASNVYFPTRIVILSHDGKLISDFWNSGNIYDIVVHDLYSENDTKEVIVSGINNEERNGILFIIDPFHSYGTSPQINPNYKNQDVSNGNELYYLKFPSTHFKRESNSVTTADILMNIQVNKAGVRVKLQNERVKTNPAAGLGEVIYQFNSYMEVTFVGLTDGYYNNYQQEFPDRDPLPYNDPNIIDYFRSVDYWNGSIWVKEPTMNRRYLELISAK
ncbi:MAG: hypothetical protein GWP19_01355 [Planctomycetia bacterium]|nr:hypothetical protein [Planctomycetia bacterium]